MSSPHSPALAVALSAAVLLAGCAGAPHKAPDCRPRSAYDLGTRGMPGDAACVADDYRHALRIGRELRGLSGQRAELLRQRDALPGDDPARGALQRRIRQTDVDIEAIRGIARVRGYVDADHQLPPPERKP